MEIIDNKVKTLKESLSAELKPGSKLAIAAACFSIYAYQALKDELQSIESLRFIFTSPTFTAEKAPRERREFYIPRLNRERSLYGSEFEVRLRNELTQKAIARECAEWIKKKATFCSNVGESQFPYGMITVGDTAYMPVNSFTTVDLGCEKGNSAYNMIMKLGTGESRACLEAFEKCWNDKKSMQDVTETVLESITAAYRENAPEFIYFVALYNIFHEFLKDLSDDDLPKEETGYRKSEIWNKLYNFQRDAAVGIINKLERYNGCILADSVGLGKTFTALAVIKYYECRNRSVLVLCPKKLCDNWNTFKHNYGNNPIAKDRLRYDVLFHTDLSRLRGESNGIDLARIRWDTYDLVVIDESHNFRNGGKYDNEDEDEGDDEDESVNRYARLLKEVIRKGVKTRVLMLSATPVNNRFNDLRNQLRLAYEGHTDTIDPSLSVGHSLDEIFRTAQRVFNGWSKLPVGERTAQKLQSLLDFDFFKVLDAVTIARSREHIQRFYDTSAIGAFPKRLPPISLRSHLTALEGVMGFAEIIKELNKLNLMIYMPSYYILPSRKEKYRGPIDEDSYDALSQENRELGIRRLMAINLLKRLESSVEAFRKTLNHVMGLIASTCRKIEAFEKTHRGNLDIHELMDVAEGEGDEWNEFDGMVGNKVRIDLADIDTVLWLHALKSDLAILENLWYHMVRITPRYDSKLEMLYGQLRQKIEEPINEGNRKVIVFTAFADTAKYLYDHVTAYAHKHYGIQTALVTGGAQGCRTDTKDIPNDLNSILSCFSPISKDKASILLKAPEIDILIATDCISEGQNLQDCDCLINYDIHWNPVRIIQRFGRIDRIGSRNARIQMVNFWPDVELDDYIDLKRRVETRMKAVNLTATGDEDLLSPGEEADLEYRRQQMQRLRDEVVDMEDVTTGVSILDLGLNEFRMDLLEYMKQHPEIERAPLGLNAVVAATQECPRGTIFVLRNRRNEVNIDNRNQLHPFYMVYVAEDGRAVHTHLEPKAVLDAMRLLCRGKAEPLRDLCAQFNQETQDGYHMDAVSKLLSDAVASIVEVKCGADMEDFLNGKMDSLKSGEIKGLDDFELICFLAVR